MDRIFPRHQIFRVSGQEQYLRLLWTDYEDEKPIRHALITLRGEPKMPTWLRHQDLCESIDSETLVPSAENPVKIPICREEDLPNDPTKRQEYKLFYIQRVALVRRIASLGRKALVPSERQAAMTKILKELEEMLGNTTVSEGSSPHAFFPSRSSFQLYLISYWRAGEDASALYPRYSLRGRKSYSEKFSEANFDAKIGRSGPKRTTPDVNGAYGCDLDRHDFDAIRRDAAKYLFVMNGRHHDCGLGLAFKNAHKQSLANSFCERIEKVQGPDGKLIRQTRPRGPKEWPTINQFVTVALASKTVQERIKLVEGKRKADGHKRPLHGGSLDLADGVCIYQVDWMLADIWLSSTLFPGQPCGRPYVYFVTEMLTRMIVGIYVTFDPPDFRTGAMALVEAMSPKVPFGARYGVQLKEEDWPCHHVPAQVIIDGGELNSKLGDFFPNGVADFCTAPAYRPELKAIVERSFGFSTHGHITFLEGAVYKNPPAELPEAAKRATHTIEEFTRELIIWVVETYNKRWVRGLEKPLEALLDRKESEPLALWNWARARHWGKLPELSRAQLIRRIMPRATAKLTRQGLDFRGVRYSAPIKRLNLMIANLVLDSSSASMEPAITYDPNDTNQVHVVDTSSEAGYFTVPIVDRSPYRDSTFLEAEKLQESEKSRKRDYLEANAKRGVVGQYLKNGGTTNIAAQLLSPGDSLTRTVVRNKEIAKQQSEERVANAISDPTKSETSGDRPSEDATPSPLRPSIIPRSLRPKTQNATISTKEAAPKAEPHDRPPNEI